MPDINTSEYKTWLAEVKAKISRSQVKAAIAVNSALIHFYWELGKMIAEKQKESSWGDQLLNQLSADLKSEFPEMKGFSRTNLYYTRQFYLYFSSYEMLALIVPQAGGQADLDAIIPQLGGQLPWGHIKVIISKIKNPQQALFYIHKTIENNWSRDTLALQIKSGLYGRQGQSITNFDHTLPEPQSDLAKQTLKDPYVFDFLSIAETHRERDIEKQLVQHVGKFLLELGKGFAFVGQQHHLEIAGNDYYLDLLFYHITLKCYVVIELKNTKFIPEYAGKMNFYLSAVDSLLKKSDDNPTIGILLCRDKNNLEVEFALRDLNKPMGVSEFQLSEALPDELKPSLPTIEEIEREFGKDE